MLVADFFIQDPVLKEQIYDGGLQGKIGLQHFFTRHFLKYVAVRMEVERLKNTASGK